MKLYIGNLAYNVAEEDVRSMLEEYGSLESFDWITDKYTGKSRGFCFAEMDNSSADKAIKALNGKEFHGRNLKINQARQNKKDKKRRRFW